MSCTINRYKFSKTVDFVAQFSATKSPKECLKCIKLEFGDNTITLSAFDGESQVESTVDCECNMDGHVLVDAARLQRTLKVCDAEYIVLDTVGDDQPHALTLENHDDLFELIVNGEDLPSLPSVSEYHNTLPDGFLTRANAMSIACDTDNSRYALGAVFFRFNGEGMAICTTDGRRLMYYSSPESCQDQGDVMIPYPVIRRIVKLGESTVYWNNNMYLIESGNIKVAGRQIEGKFPNFRKMLEECETWNVRRIIDRKLLLSAIQRATLVCTKENNASDWIGCGRTLVIKCKTPEHGSAKAQLSCEREDGDANFSISLNSQMLAEMLAEFKGDEVRFTCTDDESKVMFVCDGVKMIQMPMSKPKPKVKEEEATV